jgi:hypothetical protein
VLIVPVNTVHGFEYGMDSDGWVLTVAEPYLCNLLDRMPELRSVWSEPRILSLAVDDEEARITIDANTAWINAINVAM